MVENEEKVTEITFESAAAEATGSTLEVKGIPADLLRSPEKIRQLMDLLELPEGTNARITVVSSSVIVR